MKDGQVSLNGLENDDVCELEVRGSLQVLERRDNRVHIAVVLDVVYVTENIVVFPPGRDGKKIPVTIPHRLLTSERGWRFGDTG